MKKIILGMSLGLAIMTASMNVAEASDYTVQKGDTLSKIATKYKTTTTSLKKLNNLTSDNIKLGQVLQIDDIVSEKKVTNTYYTVVKGDTLNKIATQKGIKLNDLLKLNNLTSKSSIKVGQKLIVKQTTTVVNTTVKSNTTNTTNKATTNTSTTNTANTAKTTTGTVNNVATTGTINNQYTVVSGDTLTKIATKNNMNLDELLKLNNLTSKSVIKVGQKLVVKDNKVKVIEEVKSTVVSNVSTYTVVSGDSLSAISKKTGITQSNLMKYNNLTTTSVLKIGQVLSLIENNTTSTVNNKIVNNDIVNNTISNNAKINSIINELKTYIGIPYLWGGTTVNGFDCSGLLYYAFNNHGIKLPRTSYTMSNYGKEVDLNNLEVGDFLYFETSDVKDLVTHVGIYIGNNEMLHAGTSKGVTIDTVKENSYWQKRMLKANRMF